MNFFFRSMEQIIFKAVVFSAAAFLISGCAALEKTDHNRLSHPAMDFNSRNTPKPFKSLTNMAVDEGSGGGGCAVCAH